MNRYGSATRVFATKPNPARPFGSNAGIPQMRQDGVAIEPSPAGHKLLKGSKYAGSVLASSIHDKFNSRAAATTVELPEIHQHNDYAAKYLHRGEWAQLLHATRLQLRKFRDLFLGLRRLGSRGMPALSRL